MAAKRSGSAFPVLISRYRTGVVFVFMGILADNICIILDDNTKLKRNSFLPEENAVWCSLRVYVQNEHTRKNTSFCYYEYTLIQGQFKGSFSQDF